MKIQSFFSTANKCGLAFIFCAVLLSSCGSESQPAEQTPPAGTADTTQAAAPTATEASATAPKFDFEHFGSYDLSTWKSMPSKNEEGGDVEIEVLVYEKDGLKLEIEETSKGEYGLDIWYRLTGADGKVQKVRSLEFSNDPYAITETVNDYTVKPAKKYSRTQEVDKHYSQMNPLPATATGAWKEGDADKL